MRTDAKAAPTNLRVLLVDDDTDALELLASQFRKAGHDVRVASDATSALAEVETFHPQVAIIDIGLPGTDGYSLAREIRSRERCHLIALSGYRVDTAPPDTLVTSFDRHLIKPVEITALLQLIAALP